MPYIPILCDQRLTKNKEIFSNLAIKCTLLDTMQVQLWKVCNTSEKLLSGYCLWRRPTTIITKHTACPQLIIIGTEQEDKDKDSAGQAEHKDKQSRV